MHLAEGDIRAEWRVGGAVRGHGRTRTPVRDDGVILLELVCALEVRCDCLELGGDGREREDHRCVVAAREHNRESRSPAPPRTRTSADARDVTPACYGRSPAALGADASLTRPWLLFSLLQPDPLMTTSVLFPDVTAYTTMVYQSCHMFKHPHALGFTSHP